MTSPRVVRPRSDTPRLPLTVGLGLACLVVGYHAGARIFRPGSTQEAPGGLTGSVPDAPEHRANGPDALPPPDAAAVPSVPPAPVTRVPGIPSTLPLAIVHVGPGVPSGCGDGEQIDRLATACDNPPGLEAALRTHLGALGRCPAAAAAASVPTRVLSLGVRVSYDRHQIAVVLGRSTTVPDRVSYQPCAVDTLRNADDVWATHGAHPRYFYYYTLRFSPLTTATVQAPQPAVPQPAVPHPAVPQPAVPQPVAPPSVTPPSVTPGTAPVAAPSGALPTPAGLAAMRATGHATVTWERAVVRDAPRDGAIVGRLPQGTEVELLDRRGSWWAVRWDHDHTGWVFREAIGQTP